MEGITFAGMTADKLVKAIAAEVTEMLKPYVVEVVEEQNKHNKLLKRQEVIDYVLNCSGNVADTYFLNRSDFPYIEFGEKGKRYPAHAVNDWIERNTINK